MWGVLLLWSVRKESLRRLPVLTAVIFLGMC